MSKIVPGLTDSQVRNAKPKPRNNAREYRLASGRGLYLRVRPNGSRSWLFNYQPPYSKSKGRTNLGLGIYPDVSLKAASDMRDLYRSLLAQRPKIDPQDYIREQDLAEIVAKANTLQEVSEKWIKVRSRKKSWTTDYRKDVKASLATHIYPKLGEIPISKIDAQAVLAVLEPLETVGKFETVNRLAQRLNMIVNFAINTGILGKGWANPLVGISEGLGDREAVRFPTIEPKELGELVRAARTWPVSEVVRNLFYWQLHTMVRPKEAAGTRWDEIDKETGIWTIPPSRMKRSREHKVLLTKQTLEILETMRSISGNGVYVFPADRKPNEHANSQTVNAALKRNGYKGMLVSHGLRALASTTLNERKHDAEMIEICLSHVEKNKSRDAYNRSDYIERRQVVMDWWSDHINAAATGEVVTGKKHLKIAG